MVNEGLGDAAARAVKLQLIAGVDLLLCNSGSEVQIAELDLVDLTIPVRNLVDVGALILGGAHLNIHGDIVTHTVLIVEVALGNTGREAVGQHASILDVLHGGIQIVVDKLSGVILLTVGHLAHRLTSSVHCGGRGIGLTVLQHDAVVGGDTGARIANTSHPGVQELTDRRAALLIDGDGEGVSVVMDQRDVGETLARKTAFKLDEVHREVGNAVHTGVARLNNALRTGVSRGVFTNEAGLGSSAFAYEGVEGRSPQELGCLGIFQVFADTILMCTVTGLCILCCRSPLLEGAQLTFYAYESALGPWGGKAVSLCTALFALATLVAWSCYGREGLCYLTGGGGKTGYALAAAGAAVLGCVLPLGAVFQLGDAMNGLMALPNLAALFCLRREVLPRTRHLRRKPRGIIS